MTSSILSGDCETYLKNWNGDQKFDLTFLDPPFNQGKEYRNHYDSLTPFEYWNWMKRISSLIFQNTSEGGAIYFMQREKNVQFVLDTLSNTGWTFQNLIIWKKKASAVPSRRKFGKHYQIIAFFTKGEEPRIFNKLRITPPLLITEKYERKNGMYVTDVWDDIRELTSGYFSGEEPLRSTNGERVHNQQSPIQLLLRIILSSSKPKDQIFDPFAGTGTTLVVSKQMDRDAIGIESDPHNVSLIEERLKNIRNVDRIEKYHKDYIYTQNLDGIWHVNSRKLEDYLKSKNFYL